MSNKPDYAGLVLEIDSDGEVIANSEAEIDQQQDSRSIEQLASLLRFLRRKIATAQTEAANAQVRAQRADSAAAHARGERDAMLVTIQSANVSLRNTVLCPICGDVLDKPVATRECGHTFCLACLANWHTMAFDNASAAATGTIRPLIPPIQSEQMARLQPTTMRDIIVTDRIVRRARFDCPYCRRLIVRGPIPNFVAKEIVERVRLTHPQDLADAAMSDQRNANALTLMKRYFEDMDGI